MRPLDGGVLVLEPQVAAHADEMFAVLADPAIYAHEGEPPASPERLSERFARLESRVSPDGRELWLNWVVRPRGGAAVGYVQATVYGAGRADIAYVFASAHWGRGLALLAVQAMIDELIGHYAVQRLSAVLKRGNTRSRRLLERLGFAVAGDELARLCALDPDETLMMRDASAEAITLRVFLPTDIDAARALWQATPGLGLSAADAPAAIAQFLARNPLCSQVATCGATLVAAGLCGHDGRRGWIHHLAVDPAQRRRGLGRALLQRALSALREAGIDKCHLMVFDANRDALAFWRAVGARERVELALFSLPTPPA